jgi:hypothetical protein
MGLRGTFWGDFTFTFYLMHAVYAASWVRLVEVQTPAARCGLSLRVGRGAKLKKSTCEPNLSSALATLAALCWAEFNSVFVVSVQ